jgi:voltage-gated potassium channel
VASCIFYVISTYDVKRSTLTHVLEAVFPVVFLVDYALTLRIAPSPIEYAASPQGIIDVLSILPILGLWWQTLYALSFLRFMRLLKAFRMLRLHR